MPEREPTSVTARAFVGGKWVEGGSWAERLGPYTGTVVSRALLADASMVERALAYAAASARTVRRLTPARRADVLQRAATLAEERRDDIARLLALELGKPMRDSRGEIVRVADTFAICALEARRLGGEVIGAEGWERGRGTTAFTYRAPLGVVVAITPFNAPANLLAHKLGASFAAGNTTIVKPPPQAQAASNAIIELMLDAGMPTEAIQVLHGGGDVGAALVASPVVGAVSFTGSAAAGDSVARAAGPKRLVLELGGNAATIVCEDAELAVAAANCARTGFSNSGQSCISVQRVYAHRSVFDDFVELLTNAVSQLRVQGVRPCRAPCWRGRNGCHGAAGSGVTHLGGHRQPERHRRCRDRRDQPLRRAWHDPRDRLRDGYDCRVGDRPDRYKRTHVLAGGGRRGCADSRRLH